MSSIGRYLPDSAKQRIYTGMARLGWVRALNSKAFDEPFRPLWAHCQPYTMTTIERCYSLHQAVRYVASNTIPGAFVECGVWRGGSSMMAALTAQQVGWQADFFMFDTYAGMTRPDPVDGVRAMLGWQERQRPDHNEWAYASEDEVRRNMISTGLLTERLTMVKGPVEETIPHPGLSQIALLRLDTDWYASTLHELEHLYPLLSPGGVLIIDDYGAWDGARRAVDEYFADSKAPPLLTRVDPTGRVAIKT